MTIKAVQCGARVPGPLGVGDPFGQTPGVLRLGPAGLFPAPKQAAPAAQPSWLDRIDEALAKKFTLPPSDTYGPAKGKNATINEIDWPLFNPKGKNPIPEDVYQHGVQNCALASILGALAHTPKGQKRIISMIEEHKAPTLSTYSGDFQNFKGPKKILGKRYFTVTFPGAKPVEISSVFYTDDQKLPNTDMIYMQSRAPRVLWPCVLEKAYAQFVNGYGNFSGNPTVVWEHVVGKYKYLNLQSTAAPKVSDKDVIRQAQKANREPMIAARERLFHGFVVKGASRKTWSLILYDQMIFAARDESVKIAQLRKDSTVLYYTDL